MPNTRLVTWEGLLYKFLGIQSPKLRMVIEPKYYSEEVIGHPNHYLTILRDAWGMMVDFLAKIAVIFDWWWFLPISCCHSFLSCSHACQKPRMEQTRNIHLQTYQYKYIKIYWHPATLQMHLKLIETQQNQLTTCPHFQRKWKKNKKNRCSSQNNYQARHGISSSLTRFVVVVVC